MGTKKQKTKVSDFIDSTTFDEVYNYYVLENHSKDQCIDHFNTTIRIFRAFLEHHNLKKPRNLAYTLSCETKKAKYGDPNYNNREKTKQTCLTKYGCESPLENREIWQKTYETTLARYGGTGFGGMSNAKMLDTARKGNAALWEKYYADTSFKEAYQTSQNKTKKANKTFNASKREVELYNKLIAIYGEYDVMAQYRDIRYPFNCDFYIKSLDLFIELNAHWTHGEHPFDSANEADLNKLME